MSSESLGSRWLEALRTAPGSSSLASTEHPLRLFFGSDDGGRPRLVLVLSERPRIPALGELVRVERGQRHSDGQWTLVLTLLDTRLIGVFISLTSDLLDGTADSDGERQAMERFLAALGDWRRLLTAKGPRDLSLEALRGLCGELWVALNHFVPTHTFAEVIAAWEGPLGRPQDFAFSGRGLFEVKAIGSTSTKIKISSAEQLDAPSGLLELVVLRLPTASEETPDSFSLTSLMDEASLRLADEPDAWSDLRLKVSALGVELTRDIYGSTYFVAESISRFCVDEAFPALRASALPPAIANVRYELSLASIAPFLLEHQKF